MQCYSGKLLNKWFATQPVDMWDMCHNIPEGWWSIYQSPVSGAEETHPLFPKAQENAAVPWLAQQTLVSTYKCVQNKWFKAKT